MASLDDFKETGGVSLDDFVVDGPLRPVGNESSNINLAAHTAALSEDPTSIEATYLKIADRLNTSGDGKLAKQLLESARGQVQKRGQDAFVGIMTDPDLSDEEKQRVSSAYMDEKSSLYDIQNIAATEALIAESDPDESVESENARINFAGSIEEANQFRKDKQALFNSEMAKNNQGMMGNIVDFLEIMIPFSEGSVSGRTLSKMRDGDAGAIAEGLAWTGGSKAKIRDAMKNLPIDKRRQVMKSIVDAANESSSIIYPGDNELMRSEMLRIALEDNSYGTGEEWLDNSIAVLDMMGLFGAGVAGVRAGARKLGMAGKTRGLQTPPTPSAEQRVSDKPYIAAEAPDDELRAAEDAAEVSAADRNLRAEEDASEQRLAARRAEAEADPVRRAESGAEAREQSRRAVRGEGEEALSELEAASESRITARRAGGNAARMTDEELRMSEDAAVMRSKARTEAAKAPVQPASYSQTLRNTNPAKARGVNQAVTEDMSGQVAQATYGSNRTDALTHDHLPEIKQIGGEVKNKVSMPTGRGDGPVRLPKSIKDVSDSNGAIYYSDAQKVDVATKVIHDFNNATGIVTRTEMTVPKGRDIGGSFKVGVTYGPRDNGWTDAVEGADKVKASLRNFGIRDDDITVLGRQGDEYVPTDLNDPKGSDFLIQVDYDYPIGASEVNDLTDATDATVLRNFFDRMPHVFGGKMGSLTRHLMDPASMFDKHLLGGAAVGVNRSAVLEKRLGELVNRFSKKFNKLSSEMKNIFDQEIRRANMEGWNKKRMTLKAEGWDDDAIEALNNWREAWDTMYWLENSFLAKNLRNNGYGLFVDSSTDSRLFVKEYKRGAIPNHARVYDPQTGKMRNLEKHEIDQLYEEGGSIGQLKSKFLVDGDEAAEQVIVKNEPSSYVRRLRDDDQVLNYREGYYTVYYDAPRMVDEIVTNARGQEVMRKAVATSPDLTTATRTANRLNDKAPANTRYVARDAKERQSFGSDDTWSIQEATGRVAQKVRGERLEDSSSAVTDAMNNHVLGPADALIKAVRGIAPKAGMGDVLDAMKLRTIKQFGHMFPKDKFGNPTFPKNSGPDSIKSELAYGDEARDARSIVEYINSLERPYFNLIDDGVKYFFRAMADASSKRGLTYAERALEFSAEAAQPTRLGKGMAFTLYLVLNPLRQFVVQSFQATQLLALAPKYVSTKMPHDMAQIIARKTPGIKDSKLLDWSEGSSKQEIDEMFEAFENSGSTAVIDKSNLIKGTMQEVADATAMGGRRSVAGQVTGRASQGLAFIRGAGFDAGENINKLSSWVTHYHLAKQKVGARKLTKSEIDEVTFKSENWTYMMNRAGEMPYNENMFGMVAQFIQVPHKALLNMSTNRHLSWNQKARLTAFNVAFFGAVPGTFLYSAIGDKLPTEQEGVSAEAREALMQGLGAYLFNQTVGGLYNHFSGEKKWNDIDFSSMRAIDGQGLWEFGTDLLTTDVGEIIANTPAGSLLMGYNPRVANAIKKVAEFAHFREPADGSIATLSETMTAVASVSSGMSNLFKAIKIMEYEKKYNAQGGVTMENVATPTAIAQLFGINTVEEARKWYSDNELYEKTKAFEDDVKERYRLMSQDLFREGMSQEEDEFAMRTLNYINKEFGSSPRAQEIMLREIKSDVANGKDVFMMRAMRSMSFLAEENPRGMINAMPITDERKAQLHKIVDDIRAVNDKEE